MVANPARDQLNGKSNIYYVPVGNLGSRDGCGRPVPRQPAHSPHPGEIMSYSQDFSRFPHSTPASIHIVNRLRVSPELLRTDGAHHPESAGIKGQESSW